MLDPSLLCSARIVRPFLELMTKHCASIGEIESEVNRAPDSRIVVARAYDLVDGWVRVMNDDDLGLRASERTCIGSFGPLDYAFHTAATLREALELAKRYAMVISEALTISVLREEDRALICMASPGTAPRAIDDLILGSWYRVHLAPHLDARSDIECLFTYAEPASVHRHHIAFRGARLTFGAPFTGFTVAADTLDNALASANVALHEMHCERLSLLDLGALPQTLAMRVQRILADQRGGDRITSKSVAERLRMSRRTLARQLAAEGTSFTRILDEHRRVLALRLLRNKALSLTEVARRLGFARVEAFHRAFKRWTGSSPLRYFEGQRRSAATT